MVSGSSKEKKSDPEDVKKIIHTLKTQGYFDQLRKECIADADTKPAYHNLQQRVESYVGRFLSQQKWSPDLNKNQLRDSLRRQINQTGMLNKGVERIVEQIVNPKIMQLIKPRTDEVTCDFYGISLTEHKKSLQRKQLEQQEQLMKSPDTPGGLQSLLNINFNSPPPASNANPFVSTSSPAMPPGQFNQAPPTAIVGPNPPTTQYPPQMMINAPIPAGLGFPGISQQNFPFLPPGWNASMNTGFPPMFPPTSQMGNPFQTFALPPGVRLGVPPPAAGGVLPIIPGALAGMVASSTASAIPKPSPGKGLNALLGLPTPSEEPAPPGTVVLPDGFHTSEKKKSEDSDLVNVSDDESMLDRDGEKEIDFADMKVVDEYVADADVTVQEVGSQDPDTDAAAKAVNEQIQEAFNERQRGARGMVYAGDETEIVEIVDGESKRPYKFAWDEDIQEVDIEDSVDSSDVSSVHTSDLSEFEGSEESGDDDLQTLQNKLLQLQSQKDETEEVQVSGKAGADIPELAVEETAAETSEVKQKPDSSPIPEQAATPSPTTADIDAAISPSKLTAVVELSRFSVEPSQMVVNVKPGIGGVEAEVDEVTAVASVKKPRKLLSLQYNYSDSEDEESREERKARIFVKKSRHKAKEKEERYQRRLQRRAELEAKRKEREEEKLRQKREKLELATIEKSRLQPLQTEKQSADETKAEAIEVNEAEQNVLGDKEQALETISTEFTEVGKVTEVTETSITEKKQTSEDKEAEKVTKQQEMMEVTETSELMVSTVKEEAAIVEEVTEPSETSDKIMKETDEIVTSEIKGDAMEMEQVQVDKTELTADSVTSKSEPVTEQMEEVISEVKGEHGEEIKSDKTMEKPEGDNNEMVQETKTETMEKVEIKDINDEKVEKAEVGEVTKTVETDDLKETETQSETAKSEPVKVVATAASEMIASQMIETEKGVEVGKKDGTGDKDNLDVAKLEVADDGTTVSKQEQKQHVEEMTVVRQDEEEGSVEVKQEGEIEDAVKVNQEDAIKGATEIEQKDATKVTEDATAMKQEEVATVQDTAEVMEEKIVEQQEESKEDVDVEAVTVGGEEKEDVAVPKHESEDGTSTVAVKEEIEKSETEQLVERLPEVTTEVTSETAELTDTSVEQVETAGDTSVNTDTSAPATETSANLDVSAAESNIALDSSALESNAGGDTSLAEVSSPEKKGGKKRKTKAELKAALKEQKVMERRSRRQKIRNKRYMSDEYVYKNVPSSHLNQSYDETMVIEETVEMEIESEPQTLEINDEQIQLVEIPMPGGADNQVTMGTMAVEITEIEDQGDLLTTAEGQTFLLQTGGNEQLQISGDTYVAEGGSQVVEVAADDTTAGDDAPRVTRSRSKVDHDVKTAETADKTNTQQSDASSKRKRHISQTSPGEPAAKRAPLPPHTSHSDRQLRKSERQESKANSKKSYNTDDLYKPRHSFSRKSMSSPPPLPSEPPLPPSDPAAPSPPPLPPLPPPPADNDIAGEKDDLPHAPASPDGSNTSDVSSQSSKASKKRKRHSRSRSRSPKRKRKSRSSSRSTKSRKRKRSRSRSSRSRSLSSISSDSRSRSYSRSYSRSASSSRSRSRSVSRSRSRSISSISSKRSSYSDDDDSEERRRKARPLSDVDFGEAAKWARHSAMVPPGFGPRGPMGPMGPRPPMGPMGPRGPLPPRPFPMRPGMPPMVRGPPRGMMRGRFPSPIHVAPDGSPIRAPGISPSKPYFPPTGTSRFMPPAPGWEEPLGGRARPFEYGEDEYYPPEDVHGGPGKTGITERGTLYREDKSPSPIPERKRANPPPPVYREGRESNISPPVATGITERGTIYREDRSPSPPLVAVHRRRLEEPVSPPARPRIRHESLTPSPPPIPRHRTRSTRSDSYESISPSPPPYPTARRVPVSPPAPRNTPPVLRRSKVQTISTPSPPSSGELTPSPPDLHNLSQSPGSPVSPGPLGPVSPLSPAPLNPASPSGSSAREIPALSLSPPPMRIPKKSARRQQLEAPPLSSGDEMAAYSTMSRHAGPASPTEQPRKKSKSKKKKSKHSRK